MSGALRLCGTVIWLFTVSQIAAQNTKTLLSSHVSVTDRHVHKNRKTKNQEVRNPNWLLPERKYLNVICMWLGVDLRRQSRVLHVSYEATEILQNIPVGARLISAAAYLAVAADRRLEGGLGGTGAGGYMRGRVFILSFVLLNRFTISSEIIVLRKEFGCSYWNSNMRVKESLATVDSNGAVIRSKWGSLPFSRRF